MDPPSDLGDGGAIGRRLEHLGLPGSQGGVPEDERVGGQCRVDDAQPGMDPAHRLGQLGGRGVLDDEAVGPGLNGAPQESGTPEGRDDEDSRGRQPLQETRGRAQPVGAGHVNVHEDDVGPVLECDGQNVVPVPDLGDDLDVGLQGKQCGQRPAHHGLVIGQHHSDHRSAPSTQGSSAPTTRVLAGVRGARPAHRLASAAIGEDRRRARTLRTVPLPCEGVSMVRSAPLS